MVFVVIAPEKWGEREREEKIFSFLHSLFFFAERIRGNNFSFLLQFVMLMRTAIWRWKMPLLLFAYLYSFWSGFLQLWQGEEEIYR